MSDDKVYSGETIHDDRLVSVESHGDMHVQDIALCKTVFEELEKSFPGHPWKVGADHRAGYVAIGLLYFDALRTMNKYAYLLHVNTLKSHDGLRRVKLAGGEMLERWNLARSKAKESDKLDAAIHGLDASARVH